jgi:hypothetical protein
MFCRSECQLLVFTSYQFQNLGYLFFDSGLTKQQIVKLFKIIDKMMTLPEQLGGKKNAFYQSYRTNGNRTR